MLQHLEPTWRARGSIAVRSTQRPGIACGRALTRVSAPSPALVLCAFVGCAYQPGSFAPAAEFPGQRTTVGCIDVAVERRADLPIGPVLGYRFANRCDHATTIDLGAATVIGRGADAPDAVLRPYDPRSELRPLAIDGRKLGGEAIAYPARRAIAQVCVDVATLVRHGPSRWLCFGGVPGAASASTAGLQAHRLMEAPPRPRVVHEGVTRGGNARERSSMTASREGMRKAASREAASREEVSR